VLDTSAGFAAQALAATADLTTPVAVVEETVLERNLARMATLARDSGLKLRPHAKTHKSPFIARRQLEHGAVGLTAATLHEAEVFADAGGRCWDRDHGRADLARLVVDDGSVLLWDFDFSGHSGLVYQKL